MSNSQHHDTYLVNHDPRYHLHSYRDLGLNQLLRIPHSSDLGYAESVQEQPGVHEDADIVGHHRTGANCRNNWAGVQLDTAAVGMLKLA